MRGEERTKDHTQRFGSFVRFASTQFNLLFSCAGAFGERLCHQTHSLVCEFRPLRDGARVGPQTVEREYVYNYRRRITQRK